MLPIDAFAHLHTPTPVEVRGGVYVKRDDLFLAAGAPGGKARTCWHLAQGAKGLVTASSRASPQMNIVARIARYLNIPARLHCPQGQRTPEMEEAAHWGGEIIQHRAGYNSVIKARARNDAATLGWTHIPFGMECMAAVSQTATQVTPELRDLLPQLNRTRPVRRIVVPVGSGMSMAGVLRGLSEHNSDVPVLGVAVGAYPQQRLDTYAPLFWAAQARLVQPGIDYHDPAPVSELHGLKLDPIYEAKCIPFLEEGDLLWVVGIRASAV